MNAETRYLWVIEELRIGAKKWSILPNTVQLRKCHCQWDIRALREDYPAAKYRITKYVPVLGQGE